MEKLTISQQAVLGVLSHYQMIERRIAASKAQAQQMKRQPAPELSARQRRKADKARRRAEKEYAREQVRRLDHPVFDESATLKPLPPLKVAFDEGMAILDDAYENRPLTP